MFVFPASFIPAARGLVSGSGLRRLFEDRVADVGGVGIPGLALSVERYSVERGHEMHPFIHELIEKIYVNGNFEGLLNVNFPLRGICDWDHFKLVSQGLQTYSNIIDARINSRGQDYYWLAGDLDCGKEDVPTDVEYARKGYITGVTLTWKQQDNAAMHTLTNILEKI